ncbi:hypothetical protein IS519_07160 [Vibrio crassostreae]|nr:hypothetical protein IS519_07160 [Vibrio crassostreae]
MASLKTQIGVAQVKKAKQGEDVYMCQLNYIWVRERYYQSQ